jgi:hypothetical protein
MNNNNNNYCLDTFYDEVDFEKIDKKSKNSSGKTGSTNTIIKNLCGKFEYNDDGTLVFVNYTKENNARAHINMNNTRYKWNVLRVHNNNNEYP